jgi:hypothetical protein
VSSRYEDGEAPPRPFRTWGALYALVLLELALVIVGFGVFTRWFK